MKKMTVEQVINFLKIESAKMPNMDVEKILERVPDECLTEREWGTFWSRMKAISYTDPMSGNRYFYG